MIAMKALSTLLTAAALAAAPAGMDPDRLAKIPAAMRQFVEQGTTAGIVTLVARHGETVQISAVGFQDREARIPMRPDSIFQIASMTKPITAIGVMILVEEGLVSLADPIEKHLPDFKGLMVRDGTALRKPARPPTIRDLMTHTSGMGAPPPAVRDIFAARDRTLAEAVALYSQTPLDFDPGQRWQYSNTGIATLGRLIEVVSGLPYEKFMAERIFEPLGMKDSFFFVPSAKKGRICAMYSFEHGRLERARMDVTRAGGRYPAPEGGLYSTAPDLAAVYQMMLNRGVLNGRRILSPASVELMTQVHTGNLTAGFSPGMGYGLGWAVVREPAGTFRLNSIGTFGHGGAWRTFCFVDPVEDMFGILLMQRISPDGDMADEISSFSTLAGAAIVK